MYPGKWLRGTVIVLVGLIVLALVAGLTQAQEPEPPEGEGGAEVEDSATAELVGPLADFNHDNYADLAIGVPYEDVGSTTDAGAVNVIYGSDNGLTAAADQFWHHGDYAELQDYLGEALAAGDFDGDDYADLAIGIPGGDVGSIMDAGTVRILYGANGGLTLTGTELWHQDVAGIDGGAEDYDDFGHALTAGDFDGDGCDDLAVGVPYEAVGSITNAGAVNVIYGSETYGLTATGNQMWHQDVTGIADAAENGDFFGEALAAGDFDGDGYDDLAIGVRGEDVGSSVQAGAINVIYGSADGLTAAGNQFGHQDSPYIADQAEDNDFFGAALTAGDFDGDGYDDLAIGVPSEDVDSIHNAGAVNVIYGSADGLIFVGNQFWYQGLSGIEGIAETEDYFGDALTAGDFDGDGYADLAIGVPDEDWGSSVQSGAVNVIYGSAGGLTATADQYWHQDVPDIEGVTEDYDRFGRALAAGDFDDDGHDDLAIGVPGEAVGSIAGAGTVNVIYGSADGLAAAGDQMWYQGLSGIEDEVETWDGFGSALVAIPRLRQRHKIYLPLTLKQ